MDKLSDAERRARLAERHLLGPGARARTPEQVADALVGLHATDPATVFLAVAARMTGATPAAVEAALYQDVSLVRLLAMRRTMFVVGRELGPVVDASEGIPISVILSLNTPPTTSSFGAPPGNAVWMVFHSPKRSKSLTTAHTLSTGAGTDTLTATSGMMPPPRSGHGSGHPAWRLRHRSRRG